MSKRVITFGEIMLRLAPNGYYRFFQNDQMQATFGGGEANVAVSLANYGLDSAYVTKLPSHAIGQAAVDSLRYFGVDTSMIIRGGDRVGIYYLEKGASQRGSVCIYDPAHSAIQASIARRVRLLVRNRALFTGAASMPQSIRAAAMRWVRAVVLE